MALFEFEAYCSQISFEDVGLVGVKLSDTPECACCGKCDICKVSVKMLRPLTDKEIKKKCRGLRIWMPDGDRIAFMDENDRLTLYSEPDLSDPANFLEKRATLGPSWLCIVPRRPSLEIE